MPTKLSTLKDYYIQETALPTDSPLEKYFREVANEPQWAPDFGQSQQRWEDIQLQQFGSCFAELYREKDSGKLVRCTDRFEQGEPLKAPFRIFMFSTWPRMRANFFEAAPPVVSLRWDERKICEIQAAINEQTPFPWFRGSNIHLFGAALWEYSKSESRFTPEEMRLLLLEKADRERLRFERLKNKFSGVAGEKIGSEREQIPEGVRIFVWRRDLGKCIKCGSSERLEFDHIIPVTKGGSNTERNVQLLCEPCNRSKGAEIV